MGTTPPGLQAHIDQLTARAHDELDRQIYAYRVVREGFGRDMALRVKARALHEPPYDQPDVLLSLLLVAIDRLTDQQEEACPGPLTPPIPPTT
jgi:hypothetical protein